MNNKPDQSETVTASIGLAVGSRKIQLKMVVPVGEVPPEAQLEALQELTNTVVEGVEGRAVQNGLSISCKKGCGACCRQLVPISYPEARYLADLVENLPEPRRSQVRQRFDEAVLRLEESGMMDEAINFHRMNAAGRESMAKSYFGLGIACPFLENESCSIHQDRPLVCREYLVVSSPEHCANLDGEKIKRLKLPAWISSVYSQMKGVHVEGDNPYLALIMALDWANTKGTEYQVKPGTKWVQQFFEDLSGAEIPDHDAPETMLS